MNVVFMGTPDFAVPCLKELVNNKYNVAAVVSQPDKPVGRSGKSVFPPVKEIAVEENIKVYQPEKVKDPQFIETLKEINPDLIVVVAYGQILPKSILDIPRFGCINVHGSLLPKYRGAAPIQWAIINGEKTTGVTTMYMDVGMDTGDTILKKEIPISDTDTGETLFDKLSNLGANALIETIKLIESGEANREPQDNSMATYSPMLNKESGLIDWSKSAIAINNLIRGTYPWPGAFTYYKGLRLKIFNVETVNNKYDAKCGQIIDVKKDAIVVQTGNGILLIKEIQFEGSKRMSVKDYLVGHAIEKDSILMEK